MVWHAPASPVRLLVCHEHVLVWARLSDSLLSAPRSRTAAASVQQTGPAAGLIQEEVDAGLA